jgi:isopenicillin N synthase-like dioxygenase
VDWREQIDIGPFRAAFENWDTTLSVVGLRLLRHWAASLGAAEDLFDAAFAAKSGTLIKVIRYPGHAGALQGVGAHKDSGLLALVLLEDGSAGLQVERSPGRWLDVEPLPGALVVNIGELFEVATGGYLRATRHCVLARPPGIDRLSIPSFFNPDLEAKVPIIALPAELAGRCRGYGKNAWTSRIRAHPDVAQLHHGIEPTGAPSRGVAQGGNSRLDRSPCTLESAPLTHTTTCSGHRDGMFFRIKVR